MNSPYSKIFIEIMARIKDRVPEIRYINQDIGQLDNYTDRPAVSWPCILIEFEDFNFSDANAGIQIGEGALMIRLAHNPFSDSSSLTENAVREKALQYNELSYKVNQALHGWSGESFGALMRSADNKIPREDGIRLREITYTTVFYDTSASDQYTDGNVTPDFEVDWGGEPLEIDPPPFIPS